MSHKKPNMIAVEQYDDVVARVKEQTAVTEAARQRASAVAEEFESTKRERLTRFMACFNHVKGRIGEIYCDLTMSSKHPLGGKAALYLSNEEDPFADDAGGGCGVRYHAIPP